MTRLRASIYDLFILLILSSLFLPYYAYGVDYEANIRKRDAKIATALIDSGEKLFSYEKELIKNIDQARYKGLETELEPLTEMMEDVIYLLDWALRIDPNNFKANLLLGQVYVAKMDAGEGFVDKAMHQKATQYLNHAVKLSSAGTSTVSNAEKVKAKKLYDKLMQYSKEALVEKE